MTTRTINDIETEREAARAAGNVDLWVTLSNEWLIRMGHRSMSYNENLFTADDFPVGEESPS